MNWEAIAAVAETLGAIGVILTLIYLATQLRQNTRALKLNAEQYAVSENIENSIGIATSELPSLITRACMDLAQLNDDEIARFGFWANGTLRAWQHQHLLYSEDNLSAESWESSEKLMKSFLATDGFQQYWQLRRSTFTTTFQSFVDALDTSDVVSTTDAVQALSQRE